MRRDRAGFYHLLRTTTTRRYIRTASMISTIARREPARSHDCVSRDLCKRMVLETVDFTVRMTTTALDQRRNISKCRFSPRRCSLLSSHSLVIKHIFQSLHYCFLECQVSMEIADLGPDLRGLPPQRIVDFSCSCIPPRYSSHCGSPVVLACRFACPMSLTKSGLAQTFSLLALQTLSFICLSLSLRPHASTCPERTGS